MAKEIKSSFKSFPADQPSIRPHRIANHIETKQLPDQKPGVESPASGAGGGFEKPIRDMIKNADIRFMADSGPNRVFVSIVNF